MAKLIEIPLGGLTHVDSRNRVLGWESRLDESICHCEWWRYGFFQITLGVTPSGECLRRKGRHGVFAGKTV